jgi:hypothetical protein
MTVPVDIELQVVMTLPREGIVITQYMRRPRQGFSLRAESKLDCYPVASLTSTKALDAKGTRRRDLVSFCLTNKRDTKAISPGQYVYLREVEPAGYFAD